MSLSNTAKLLRAYMMATGISEPKAISTSLDIPVRTIQRLKLDIACANDATGGASETATSATSATGGANQNAEDAPQAPSMAVLPSHVPARVEDNNIITNLEPTVVSEVKESKILLRSDEPKPKNHVHGTRLDPAWALSDDLRQWTRTRFPQTTDQRIADELETFRDYWTAQAGQRGRKADWDATWRNWSKRAFATAPIRPRARDGERPVSGWEAEKAAKLERTKALYEKFGGVVQ